MPEVEIKKIKEEIQSRTASECYKDGEWYADYRRLQIIAVEEF